ncbi:MAG: copper homeostasis protein CutC [Bacteroidota bacterium]
MLVEVCANSLESALNAEKAGADRIELCSELGVGGITPSHGLILEVKKRLKIPVHILIRPRSGHFTYSSFDMEVMKNDIAFCEEIGINGIVSGVLYDDFSPDIEKTAILVQASGAMKFTFHRAFDWVPDPIKTLHQLEGLGVDYILTSGQKASAEKGLNLLEKLHNISNTCTVMAGGGVRLNTCKVFADLGLKALHLSGTSFNTPLNLKGKIPMNSAKHLNETSIAVTNEETIRQIVRSVK